jgi:ubiquinone/menaquinone biosynthesis C-methylase UbiE
VSFTSQELYGRLLTIYHLINPKPREVILDVGCSTGYFSRSMENDNIVVAIDIYPFERWKTEKSRCLNFVLASATHLPFADNTFDKVVVSELLEHVEWPVSVLKEVRRVLKPGRWVVISSPSKGLLYLNLLLDPAYWLFKRHRHFSFSQLMNYLSQAGLKPVLTFTGGLFAEQIAYCIKSLKAFLTFGLDYFSKLKFRGSCTYIKVPNLLEKVATLEYYKGMLKRSTKYYTLICIARKVSNITQSGGDERS